MSPKSLTPAPATLMGPTGPQFGRYVGAIERPELPLSGRWQRMRLKEWHYTSFSGDGALVALAIVQLGYVAKVFAYVIDTRDGWRIADTTRLFPLGGRVTMAPSSVSGRTVFSAGADRAEIEATGSPAAGGYRVNVDLGLSDGSRLRGELVIERGDGFSLLHRLDTGLPAYTHKDAGMKASADLTWGSRRIVGEGLSASDWTRALSKRETRWNWATAGVVMPDGRRVGLNLSAHVYDDANGESEENIVFVDGRPHSLGGARFELPAEPVRQPWRVQSHRDGEFDLTFHPRGAHHENTNAGVLMSRFVQPYGEFEGWVTISGERLTVDGARGVVEDHLARW